MSRARKQSDYEKTFAFRFFRWMGGEKDTFVGNMEMRPQKEYVEEEETLQERMRDRQQNCAFLMFCTGALVLCFVSRWWRF